MFARAFCQRRWGLPARLTHRLIALSYNLVYLHLVEPHSDLKKKKKRKTMYRATRLTFRVEFNVSQRQILILIATFHKIFFLNFILIGGKLFNSPRPVLCSDRIGQSRLPRTESC